MRPNLAAFRGVFHLKVDHPGNGVGAVLGGGAIAQHFHIFQGDAGDHADIGPVSPFAGAGDKLGDQRGSVPAFAVDQHQGLVRSQPPQGGVANEGVLIASRGSGVVGRHQGFHAVGKVGGVADAGEILRGKHIDGRG